MAGVRLAACRHLALEASACVRHTYVWACANAFQSAIWERAYGTETSQAWPRRWGAEESGLGVGR